MESGKIPKKSNLSTVKKYAGHPKNDDISRQFEKKKCPQCNRMFNKSKFRPALEKCGHVKCRQCFLRCISGCWQCDKAKESRKSSKVTFCEKVTTRFYDPKQGRMFRNVKHIPLTGEKSKKVSLNVKKPFRCEQCGQGFILKYHFQRHVRVHAAKRSFKCGLCEKEFKHNWSLTVHMECHSNERPFICGQCTKAFIHKRNLDRHMLCHSDAKPFKCSICGAAFRRSDTLKRHFNVH